MSTQYVALILTVISLCIYLLSGKYYHIEKSKISLLLLIVAGFILRMLVASDAYLHEWDERYHALVAKNLMEHPFVPTLYETQIFPADYKSWISSHIWLHKQPLPLWTISLSFYLFGVNEIALRLPSVILTTLGILLTFQIGKHFFNGKVAYWAAFLYSINGLIIEQSGGRIATDHIDIFFLFFIQLAIYFSVLFVQKAKYKYNILVGVSISAAILCKWLPALIVLPIWILLCLDSNKFTYRQILSQLFFILITIGILCLPWQIYIYHSFPLEAKWEAGFNAKHFTEVLEGRTGPFYYFINVMRINYGDLIYLPLGWFCWTLIKKFTLKKLALFIWILIPVAFFSLAKTKMQGYILFTSPALFIVTAAFLCTLLQFRATQKKYKWALNLLLLAFIFFPVRYMIERVKPFSDNEKNKKWVQELKKLNEKPIEKGVLLNYDRYIEAMFYTKLTAYPFLPNKNEIAKLIQDGYTVIIQDDGNLTNETKQMKGVSIVTLSE